MVFKVFRPQALYCVTILGTPPSIGLMAKNKLNKKRPFSDFLSLSFKRWIIGRETPAEREPSSTPMKAQEARSHSAERSHAMEIWKSNKK